MSHSICRIKTYFLEVLQKSMKNTVSETTGRERKRENKKQIRS